MSAELITSSGEEENNNKNIGEKIIQRFGFFPEGNTLNASQLDRYEKQWVRILDRKVEPLQMYTKFPIDVNGGTIIDFSIKNSEDYQPLLHSHTIVDAYWDDAQSESGGWFEDTEITSTEEIQHLQPGYFYKKTESESICTDPTSYKEAKEYAKNNAIPVEQVILNNLHRTDKNESR